MIPARGVLSARRRARRYAAEILTADGRLLRREYYTTPDAGRAVRSLREMWQYLARDCARADCVELYATPDGREPGGDPVAVLRVSPYGLREIARR